MYPIPTVYITDPKNNIDPPVNSGRIFFQQILFKNHKNYLQLTLNNIKIINRVFYDLRVYSDKKQQEVKTVGFEFAESNEGVVNIKVIGCGGGGCNAVNRMIRAGVEGVDFVVINTDKPVLDNSSAPIKLQIGEKLTKGKGAGSDPNVGENSALESREEIEATLRGADMVFIAAGMGGGTGTGSAPVVAEIAKDMGILTVAIVTKPFGFEGRMKMKTAEAGIEKLRAHVDSLIVIPNEKLKDATNERITLLNAFQVADDVLRQGVQSISDLILIPGLVNVDFADVHKIMKDAGNAHMGVGRAAGEDKAVKAAEMAISSPLLETSIEGATGVIFNITASPDIGMDEVDEASRMVEQAAHPDANIIWGVALNNDLDDEIIVTVIATGFPSGDKVNKGVVAEEPQLGFIESIGEEAEEEADDLNFLDLFANLGE
ncbi:MAG: cell division protein FtsZ [Clostridia bacterium]|nr:cell division protein FtsZ [Clostridia bacterium]